MAMADCIIPQRKRGWQGYMFMKFQGKYQSPHRVAWKILYGDIPKGMVIDHMCHNEALAKGECKGGYSCEHRACINPAHLQMISGAENTRAGARVLANRETCSYGHLTADNHRVRPDGRAYCKECRKRHNKLSAERKKARAV